MFDRLLRLLDKEQSGYAKAALLQPSGTTSYDYGYAVGRMAGLERARELIDELLEDREHKDNF